MQALRDLIDEARTVIITCALPQGRARRATQLLTSAVALAEDLIAVPPAAMGRQHRSKTTRRGSQNFRDIAAKRKNPSGGPKKEV
jgi:hypothetical protein